MSTQAPTGFTGPAGGTGETVIYQDPAVTVTTARAVLGGTTYAVANITSVRPFVERPHRAGFILLALLSGVFGFVGRTAREGGFSIICFLLALAVLFVAASVKAKHWVRIGTAGAETNAIWSHDPSWTSKIVAALNEAIVLRG